MGTAAISEARAAMTTTTMRGAIEGDPNLFNSTYEALRFAFNYSDQQYAESMMAKLLRRGGGSGKGLVALDGAAQVGMVLAVVARLDPVLQASIVARFAPRFEECKCCGGEKPTEAWRLAVERLAAWAVPAGISHMRVRRSLVGKHFGEKGVEFKALAERYGMNRKTLSEQHAEITKRLRNAEDRAQTMLDDEFRQRGLFG
jgi:hypothetical protein